MSRSRSRRHEGGPTLFGGSVPYGQAGREVRHTGLAAAGIACLSVIAGGTYLTFLISMGLTREYGVDSAGIGLDDVLFSAIFSLPALGLAALAVRFLRRSGLPVTAAWACLIAAVVIAGVSMVGTVVAVREFADTEGTGAVLASRSSAGFALVIGVLLAIAGFRFLRGSRWRRLVAREVRPD